MTNPENLRKTGSVSEIDYDPFAAAPTIELATTPAQREMWLSAQTGPEAICAYNESFSIRLTGSVDEEALARGLQALADCHEALRGHFSEDGERFVIEPAIVVPVTRHDLSVLPPDERSSALTRLTGEDAATPYDLSRGPLLRAAIIKMGAGDCVVILSANHAVCDGWSLDVLLADLGRLYSYFVGGAPMPTPPRHGFSDYVSSCQTPDYAARMQAHRAFWRKAFEALPPPLALPADGHRPAIRTYGARHSQHTLAPEVAESAKELARTHRLSFFSLLLSSMAALYHRLSQQNDFVIGIPVAGHPDAGMEDCVGHLVNLVPVRCRCEPGMSFLDLCRAMHTAVLDARENATVSFGEIVADLAVPRDPSRVPLIASILTHIQKYAPGKLVFAGCSVEYHLNARRCETFEVDLNVIDGRDGLQFKAHANADLYTQAWLDWRLRELECVLKNGCAHPETALADIANLPADEALFITDELNRTLREVPAGLAVHELIAAQAERTPERPAIQFKDHQVSYSQLEARANQISQLLRSRGVGRGMLVGLCLERSVDMVAAVLGVLKSGAGYLPLDPAFPADRLAFMIDDSRLALVISEQELAEVHRCPAERTLALDTARDQLDQTSSAPLAKGEHSARPEDVAYVLYTSGSTGKPKGVRIPHRAVVNFLTSMQREPGLAPDDRLLAVTTLSFDIAVLELLLPLTVGAQVILASRDDALDGVALRRLFEHAQVTVMQATPATWRLLIENGWQGHARFKALCGGEALPLDLAESLLARSGELWNMYGPTETTVWSTCWRVTDPRRGISIGRPIANTSIWILDPHQKPCPLGVPGEIHIGGVGLALDYLDRPELTRERFIAAPTGTLPPDERLYRTGDLGRWRADGLLECLGRIDFQVKVRGFRIELGEIETVLRQHPSVADAVVVVRADGGEPELTAYVVATAGAKDVESQLRQALRAQLPFYMVPGTFVFLPALPLTPNGKVDRKGLPAPEQHRPTAMSERVAPRNPTETKLSAIWAAVLGKTQFGIDDNFFDIGGSSILLMQVVAEARRQGLEMKLLTLLRHPTIRSLAEQLSGTADAAPRLEEARSRAQRQKEALANRKARHKG